MKRTMNSRNVAKFHKLLENEVAPKKCSQILNVELDTLKKFTSGAIKKARDAAKQPAASSAGTPE